ncbi:MAG TPA: tetratricopeptide repeat protein, partial [Chitinophagales bacterium]|nr:tetratricopeptide repeat protein [Chitinophagales bacterium]
NNEMSAAKTHYEEALQIRRQLATKNANAYNLDVAMTAINMALFYEKLLKTTGDMSLKKAGLDLLQDAEQCLNIYPKDHPRVQQYLSSIEQTKQFFQGIDETSFQWQQQSERANALEKEIQTEKDSNKKVLLQTELLQIYRQLADNYSDDYQPLVSMTLNNLSRLVYANNELPKAIAYLEEALQIDRQVAAKPENNYLSGVATTLNNLGALLYANNEMSLAKARYEEALQINRQLATKNPDTYLPYVARTLNNLGLLLEDNNELAAAKTYYEEALEIWRQLATQNPDSYNLDVAVTVINIGILYEKLLKTTGDMSLKKAGLDLLQDAEQSLSIYPKDHPTVQQYLPYIERLKQFFQN